MYFFLVCVGGLKPTEQKSNVHFSFFKSRRRKEGKEGCWNREGNTFCSSNHTKILWAIHSLCDVKCSIIISLPHSAYFLSLLLVLFVNACISPSSYYRKIFYDICHIIFDWNNGQNKAYRGRRWEWKGTEMRKKHKGNRNICADNQTSQVEENLYFYIFLLRYCFIACGYNKQSYFHYKYTTHRQNNYYYVNNWSTFGMCHTLRCGVHVDRTCLIYRLKYLIVHAQSIRLKNETYNGLINYNNSLKVWLLSSGKKTWKRNQSNKNSVNICCTILWRYNWFANGYVSCGCERDDNISVRQQPTTYTQNEKVGIWTCVQLYKVP